LYSGLLTILYNLAAVELAVTKEFHRPRL